MTFYFFKKNFKKKNMCCHTYMKSISIDQNNIKYKLIKRFNKVLKHLVDALFLHFNLYFIELSY